MSSLFDSLSEELFQILKGSGKTLTLYTAAGSKTYEPKNARRVFAEPDKMMVSVNEAGSDSEVKLYLSQNVDLEAVSKLINSLRMIATRYNVLFNVRKFGRELSPKDFAYQASSVNEAPMWGSTKTSYQRIGETKLIVRHCVPVREGVIGSRARNILNMFVETREGERFKFPVIHLSGARAFAQHINQGGKPHDEVGSAIIELAQESSDLAKVNRYIHHARNILDESATNMRPFIKLRINELRSTFVGLARPRAYGKIIESGLPLSSSMLCESSNGVDAEVARLTEVLKIDSNHALAKSLTPVALLTLGVNMNENITDMFHGVMTVESADALLEALADEYGYSSDAWLKMGSHIGFTDSAVFEAAQEYLSLTETDYSLFEGDVAQLMAGAEADDVDESYYGRSPYDDEEGNEAAVERSLEHFEGNFSGEGFLSDSDYSEFVDGTLGEIDKEDPVDPKYFIEGIAYQMAQALEDDGITGYDKGNPFLIQQAEALFNAQVKPVLQQHGWTIAGAVKEFAKEDGERPHNPGIAVGDFVATDMGAGQVEQIEGDLAVVMFQSGVTKTLDVSEIDKINEVSTGPEEASLQEWFDSFDAARLLAPVDESELNELSRSKKDQYFTAAAMDRGAAEKAEVEGGDEVAGKRREKRDRGLARLLSKSMMDEGQADVYHSVFAQNSDGSWSHYFDADDAEDAKDSVREIKQMGDKAIVIKVPKNEANWIQVNPDEFVKAHLAKKSAPKVEAEVVEAKSNTMTAMVGISREDIDLELHVEFEIHDGSFDTGLDYPKTHNPGDDLEIISIKDEITGQEFELEHFDQREANTIEQACWDKANEEAQHGPDSYHESTSGDMSKDLIDDVKVNQEDEVDEAAQVELANLLKNAMFRK
jgi:hypothetical protein